MTSARLLAAQERVLLGAGHARPKSRGLGRLLLCPLGPEAPGTSRERFLAAPCRLTRE